jgi:hypothetical protein
MVDDCRFLGSQKLPQKEWRVGWRIVRVQDPGIVASFGWTFVPDIFSQPPQNIAMEVFIRSLPCSNKILMHDAFSTKKNKHKSTLIWRCFQLAVLLESRRIWHLSQSWLLLRLRAVSRNPKFITSNDCGDEVVVVFGLFLKLWADSNAVFLLVIALKPGHKFHCNSSHVELMRQFDNVTNVMNLSPSVFQDNLALLSHFRS